MDTTTTPISPPATSLLQTLLERTYQVNGDPQPLYELLHQHPDHLPQLAEEIRQWAGEKFRSKNLAVSRAIAQLLIKFSQLLQKWDPSPEAGSPVQPLVTLEIAIACYQQALQVISPEAFPDEAAPLQQTLDNLLTLQQQYQQLQAQHTQLQQEQARLQEAWDELVKERAKLGSLEDTTAQTAQWEQAAAEWAKTRAALEAQIQQQQEHLDAAQQ
ncbi:MAG: hypothetical protein SNJ68_13965, partial [Cyanobacteriota bacterium]